MPALKAFLFGVTLAIAVGPIALLIMHFGITQGLRTALGSAMGAALADFSFATVAFLAGTAILPRLTAARLGIEWTASLILCAAGLWMLWRAVSRNQTSRADSPVARPGSALLTTYALTLVNPLTVVVFLGLAAQLPLGGSGLRGIGYATCLFAGSFVVQIVFAVGGSSLRPLVNRPGALGLMQAASGLGILVFGLLGLPI